MKIRDLMKFNKIYLGLLLILTILTSANLAEAEDKYTLKIATSYDIAQAIASFEN